MLSPRFSTVLAIGVCVATMACGSTSPTAPRGSSSFFGLGGAVITGHVNGAPVRATAQSVNAGPLASTTATVTIVGTDITSSIDGQGNFQLTGVPPGDVTLKFTSNGASATITLQGVATGDRIHIVVTLSGSSAKLEDEDREHDDDEDDDDDEEEDNEVKGIVAGRGGDCPVINFTVNGVKVSTTMMTKFEAPCGQIVNGKKVEVEGVLQPDGSIVATEVEFD